MTAAAKHNKLDELKTHKMPSESTFYDKIMPALFILLGIITFVLVAFAIGVATGLVHWN